MFFYSLFFIFFYFFFLDLAKEEKTLNARTAVKTAQTVWDSPKGVALPTKKTP